MKIVKVVILWVFTISILSLVGTAVINGITETGKNSPGPYILYVLIMIVSAFFIGFVGDAVNWKGFGGKKKLE